MKTVADAGKRSEHERRSDRPHVCTSGSSRSLRCSRRETFRSLIFERPFRPLPSVQPDGHRSIDPPLFQLSVEAVLTASRLVTTAQDDRVRGRERRRNR
jgi:hypothetical protein